MKKKTIGHSIIRQQVQFGLIAIKREIERENCTKVIKYGDKFSFFLKPKEKLLCSQTRPIAPTTSKGIFYPPLLRRIVLVSTSTVPFESELANYF